ncbi:MULTISPECIES: hypothetical protein [Mumia]|uniref:Uncharacterized protein n=1 Tax=Mumia xiangluensis TaxID=1678900 RepID=A0ABW1QN07_9ACTN|nr:MULTISPECIES: hypothetical protein [Mumia]
MASDSVPEDLGGRLNQLRAGVLGANDGIVSTAGVVDGVRRGNLKGLSPTPSCTWTRTR